MAGKEKTMLIAGLIWALLPLAQAMAAPLGAKSDPEALPGGIAAEGAFVAEAWLVAPTDRYRHFIHANRHEAGGIRARLADGTIVSLLLPTELVFEDAIARLADLDGDGREELVQVLTSLSAGAALAVYRVEADGIALLARTPFIGRPNRWLNPAAIADLDGDGVPEIALVQMPHLVKRLEIWALDDGKLRREARVEDVSNHRIDTPQQPLAVARDFDGDDIADLAVPNGARDTIRLLRFAGGVSQIARLQLPSPAIAGLTQSGGGGLVVQMEDGETAHLPLP